MQNIYQVLLPSTRKVRMLIVNEREQDQVYYSPLYMTVMTPYMHL